MRRSKLNLIIDVVMLLLMACIAGLGLMLEYVLIPGRDRAAVFGRHVDLYYLGLDRHDWGAVHLWIGVGLIVLLVLHVALHWRQVTGIYCRLVQGRAARWALGLLCLVVSLVLLFTPLLVTPQVVDEPSATLHHEPPPTDRPGWSTPGHGQGRHGGRGLGRQQGR